MATTTTLPTILVAQLLATTPFTLLRLLTRVDDFAVLTDPRDEFDQLTDLQARPLLPSSLQIEHLGSDTLASTRRSAIQNRTLAYMRSCQPALTSSQLADYLGASTRGASDILTELATAGHLRVVVYPLANTRNLYILKNHPITIADIPYGERNDAILAMLAQDYRRLDVADYFNLSRSYIYDLNQRWPEQRAKLLDPNYNDHAN